MFRSFQDASAACGASAIDRAEETGPHVVDLVSPGNGQPALLVEMP